MRKFGLIGRTLQHSFSQKYFSTKFEKEKINQTQYDLIELSSISEFNTIKGYSGLNVTIPYKEDIIPYLDELSEKAKKIGAVNTIQFKDGKKIGYNTDYYGFRNSLEKFIETKSLKALVLGTGGASKAVQEVLKDMNILFELVSRNKGGLTYNDLSQSVILNHKLIINTTPLGTFPNENECPSLPYQHINEEHFLYDLVYNPTQTLFMKKGKENGAKTKNGIEMLEIQAEEAWKVWNE